MVETYVRLLCPRCHKKWQATPTDLPDHDRPFQCPGCGVRRRTAEFTRTGHDLETLKTLG